MDIIWGLLFLLVFLLGYFIGYRRGQTDAVKRGMGYHRVKHPDGSKIWEKVLDHQTEADRATKLI